MKAKNLKMILPVFVLMLAVFSALAFKNVENIVLSVPETGWINLPGQPCAIQVDCNSTVSPFVCTVIYNGTLYQAFGKVNPAVLVCNKILYRPK